MASLAYAIQLVIIFLIFECSLYNAKFLTLRPLSARQVYRLLQQSGNSDALPQGRVITQGLAAMSGFALGITKGLGAAFIYDVITANVTDLNDNNGSGASSNSAGMGLKMQEICFKSRNARNLREDTEEDEEAENARITKAYGRDERYSNKDRKRPNHVKGRLKHNRRSNRKSQRQRQHQYQRQRKRKRKGKQRHFKLKKYSLPTTSGVQGDTDDINSHATNPAKFIAKGSLKMFSAKTARAVSYTTSTGSGTSIDSDDGTGTSLTSTTDTDNDGAINCVIIQKPG